jgi:hypothetical protein
MWSTSGIGSPIPLNLRSMGVWDDSRPIEEVAGSVESILLQGIAKR